jgi:hypothetical protein
MRIHKSFYRINQTHWVNWGKQAETIR